MDYTFESDGVHWTAKTTELTGEIKTTSDFISENKLILSELNNQIQNNWDKYKDRGFVTAKELLEGTLLDMDKDRLFFY